MVVYLRKVFNNTLQTLKVMKKITFLALSNDLSRSACVFTQATCCCC